MPVPTALPDLPDGVTPEALADAVAVNRSWRGVLRSFGLTSTHKGRQMRAWCDAAGISYSHFATRSWDRRALRAAVEASTSWPQLIERLGIGPDSGSARSAIRRRCAEQGIDLGAIECSAPSPAEPLPRCDTSRLRSAGAHLVAAYCVLAGWRVSWPLEPVSYDLIAEDESLRMRRIQVKTTTRRDGDSWLCGISRSAYVAGGGKVRRAYEPDQVDDFGIVDGDLRVYLVPAALVVGRTALRLRRYASFELVVPPADRR